MISETLKAWFKRTSDFDEFLRFEKIPESERLHPNRELCGLLKVAALMKTPKDFSICATHDEIYLVSADELRDDMTEEDVLYLHRCGVRWDSSHDCLAMFASG